MPERSPYDGKPYYCVCGVGFDEYMACEEDACELESEEAAKMRAARKRSVGNIDIPWTP